MQAAEGGGVLRVIMARSAIEIAPDLLFPSRAVYWVIEVIGGR